jgi:short chain dehydrogenase
LRNSAGPYAPRMTWHARQLAEQTGRTFVVTGANSGIGLEAARALVRRGAEVVLAVRDAAKGEQAAGRLEGPGSTRVVELDLSDLVDAPRPLLPRDHPDMRGRGGRPTRGRMVRQGHFTASAKRLRAEHRRPSAERRPHGQHRPQRRKSRPSIGRRDAGHRRSALGKVRPHADQAHDRSRRLAGPWCDPRAGACPPRPRRRARTHARDRPHTMLASSPAAVAPRVAPVPIRVKER